MLSSAPSSPDAIAVVRPEERPWGALVHMLGWIPVWGFVLSCLMWLFYKNRSRQMIFHIQQIFQLQIFILLPVIVWAICSILTGILSNLSASIGETLQTANTFILILALTLCACVAIYGGGMVYVGKPFLYPLFGRRVLEGSMKKISEG